MDLMDAFRAAGQEHVFAFWERLDAGRREVLVAQAQRLVGGLEGWNRARTAAEAPRASEIGAFEDTIALPRSTAERAAFAEAREAGEALLREGRVAALVVAGGQGTRLGFPGPKGGFPVGPVSERSLFEIQAQKLRRIARASGRAVPWYVMTSQATDAATRELFSAAGCFGLDPADVFIFSQGMVPGFDAEGRLILEDLDRIFENPDGHGGAIPALVASGALADMESRGVDTIYYYQVDNALVRMADPCYLGFHRLVNAEVSCKVVRKRDPMAKWGVVAQVDGRPRMVEYTELSEVARFARGADGDLLHWAGNIAIHVFDVTFVARVEAEAERYLPFHVSDKKIPYVDAHGHIRVPSEPNGQKLERFVFDILPAAERVCVLEVDPASEFSPIKNAEGEESPATARRDLIALYRDWLQASPFEPPPPGVPIEIDHSRIDSREDAENLPYASLAEADPIVRVGRETHA